MTIEQRLAKLERRWPKRLALGVVFAAVLAACRTAPDASPDELKKEAFTVTSPDGKALAYVIFTPSKPRPIPKFYDLDGYRIFPFSDEDKETRDWLNLLWAGRLGSAKQDKRQTIRDGRVPKDLWPIVISDEEDFRHFSKWSVDRN